MLSTQGITAFSACSCNEGRGRAWGLFGKDVDDTSRRVQVGTALLTAVSVETDTATDAPTPVKRLSCRTARIRQAGNRGHKSCQTKNLPDRVRSSG